MSYEVLRTATADEQVRDIAMYLASVSGSTAPALRFLDDLEEAGGKLSEFPRMGSIPRWGTLARRGYRMLAVGKYLLFYTINDEACQVIIDAVIQGTREYSRMV